MTVVSVVLVMFGFLTLSNKRSLSAGREYAMSSLYNIDHTIIINTFVPSPSLCSISRPCLAEHITTEMSRRDKTVTIGLMVKLQLSSTENVYFRYLSTHISARCRAYMLLEGIMIRSTL